MTATRAVLDTLTVTRGVNLDILAEAIEALLDTERTTSACAAAMVADSGVEHLRVAIRADMDTVDVCTAARTVLTRGSDSNDNVTRAVVDAAISACERSNVECGKHASHHGHCRLCSQSTANTIAVCRNLLNALGTSS